MCVFGISSSAKLIKNALTTCRLAQLFITDDDQCLSNKYCGKDGYKSPEIIHKQKIFDAKANDIWSLGIVLFMLSFGTPPWDIAVKSDPNFVFVLAYSVFDMLRFWNMEAMIDKKMMQLFPNIFVAEKDRVNIVQIQQYIEQFNTN